MSYFLGFVPNREANYKIRKVLGETSIIFDDFGIPVRWVKPNTYHITLLYLGERVLPFKRIMLKKKISKVRFKKIEISFSNVRVGISKTYKELVYLDVAQGGEQLRELLLEVRKYIGGKDTSVFIPHLTIGRISKDLSKEEYRNVANDIARLSKKLNLEDIKFTIEEMYLIRSEEGVYSFLMKFDAL